MALTGTDIQPVFPGDPAPMVDVAIVTTSDSNDLAFVTRAIRAETAGVIKLTTIAGSAVVCKFAAGETRFIRATRIWTTGTTVTGQIEAMH